MKIKKITIQQKQRPINQVIYAVLDKPKNEGFDGLRIAECSTEAHAKMIVDAFNLNITQAETIRKLREALKEANRTLVLINPKNKSDILRSIDTQTLIEKVLAETESQ